MPVTDAHPDALKLDEAFAAAMEAPGRPREPGPPPETDKDAPFGRDDDGKPLAPYGMRKDGKPKLSPAGRKPSEDQARVGQAPASPGARDDGKKPPAAATEPGTYARGIAETLEVVWLGGTVLGQMGPEIPVVGRFLPGGDKMQAQAAIIFMYRQNIASALDLCAQHNDSARKLAEKLAGGGAGWALNAAFMLLPVIGTSLKAWAEPELAGQLAEQNRGSFHAYMQKLAEQAEAAQAQAQQENPVPQAA